MNFDEEESEQDSSHAELTFNKLLENGKIYIGAILRKDDIEEALGVKYQFDPENPAYWEFRGPYLEFLCYVKQKFSSFISSKGLKFPEFRILTSQEQATAGDQKLMQSTMQLMNNRSILQGHDISNLNDNERKEHNHVLDKYSRTVLQMQKEIFKNKIL
jgi:hypothetical protein